GAPAAGAPAAVAPAAVAPAAVAPTAIASAPVAAAPAVASADSVYPDENALEPADSAYPDGNELQPASAESVYPDTSELDPGIAAFVEAVGAVEAPETAAPPAPTTSSASSYSSKSSSKYAVTPIVAALRRNEVDAALGDFGQLSTSFRASFTPTGLRIDAVQPGSLLAKAGFAVGDVITIVDGRPLRTIDDAADLYARAWTTSSSTVQVIRAKRALTVRIAIQ
ncbi:MAG: PDZ domain-containing protein, partial [Kofleriaceae bacterium]|nr:PDZ domain-containing protein [Kofleriaceae bacterium]